MMAMAVRRRCGVDGKQRGIAGLHAGFHLSEPDLLWQFRRLFALVSFTV